MRSRNSGMSDWKSGSEEFFALGQISRDFTDFSEPVVRLLTEYARVQSKGLEGDEAPIDLHEIMNIVRERLT